MFINKCRGFSIIYIWLPYHMPLIYTPTKLCSLEPPKMLKIFLTPVSLPSFLSQKHTHIHHYTYKSLCLSGFPFLKYTHTHTHTTTSINPYISGRSPGSKTFLSIGSLSLFTSFSASLFYSLFYSSLAFSSSEPLKARKIGSRLNQDT